MGFLVSIILIAVGFILALVVHPTNPHPVSVNSAGWILVMVGFLGFIAALVLWSSSGPGYLRRRTYVDDRPGYGAYPPRRGYPGRRVIEAEESGPQGPGY